MERAFSPYYTNLLYKFSWGFAPGWNRSAPSALHALLAVLRAEGPIHISLGRAPGFGWNGLQGLKARAMKS
jgi:hypothetical protein